MKVSRNIGRIRYHGFPILLNKSILGISDPNIPRRTKDRGSYWSTGQDFWQKALGVLKCMINATQNVQDDIQETSKQSV